ncbi:MAG TPA: DUF1501 domain-containing protein, partial [Planctomycetota bacterium]|nr:DUF1501 domain-containing protein [Planctomycetota bacterium]
MNPALIPALEPAPGLPLDLTRRAFLGRGAHGIGQIALGSMLLPALGSCALSPARTATRLAGLPHFAPRCKRVLCLFQSEGFSHIDLFDQKKTLRDFAGQELPPSVKGTQRITGMTSGQGKFPVVPPIANGRFCGASGLWISDLLPHLQTVADELCLI